MTSYGNHRHSRFGRRFCAFMALLGALGGVFLLAARAQAAIELIYFLVAAEPNRVRVEWETATELNNAGYYVLRSETGGSDPSTYDQITVLDAASGDPYDFIPARGDDLFGAVYIFYDEAVTVGNRYYYFLQDVDSSNSSSYHGPEDAVVGQTSTPTPSNTSTKTPGPPTATGGPSATPGGPTATRTNTPIPGFFPTATPTISPTPTGTLLPTETPTFTETAIPPVDLTLTAIAAALTGLPTGTDTETAVPSAEALVATQTPRATATPAGDGTGSGRPPIGRFLPVILVFLLSGALLTAGIVYIARGSSGDDSSAGPLDE